MKRPENGASVAWVFSRYSSMSGGGSISRKCASAYADILTSFLRLAAYLALTAHELPEPVGEDPCQHRPKAGAHRSTSRILKKRPASIGRSAEPRPASEWSHAPARAWSCHA